MSAVPRGRGYAMLANKDKSDQPLRRPGESGLMQRFGTTIQNESAADMKENEINCLCIKIGKMGLNDPLKELAELEKDVKSVCDSQENLSTFVDKLFILALKTRWNAHAVATFCESYGDTSIDNAKLRTLLLRKLQKLYCGMIKLQLLYCDRETEYLNVEKFLMEVRFLCEIYHHVKIDGNPIKVLSHPVLDVLCMLLKMGSQKEIEVFYEQFPKCFAELKANDPDTLDELLIKIRKLLVSDETTVNSREMLLEMFELVLTDGKPLSSAVQEFYKSNGSNVVRECE